MRWNRNLVAVAAIAATPALVGAGLPASASAAPSAGHGTTSGQAAHGRSASPQARIAALQTKPWGRWTAKTKVSMAAEVSAASDSVSIVDPVGDVVNGNDLPAVQPKADLVSASASDIDGTITFRAATVALANPLTDPGWVGTPGASFFTPSETGPTWTLFSSNDSLFEAASQFSGLPIAIVSLNNIGGHLQADVSPVLSASSGGESSLIEQCNATPGFTPSGPNAGYSVTFPSACLGELGLFYWGVSMTYDPAGDTDGALAVGDQAPDSPPLPEINTFPSTQGYWLAAADGGVFAHGSAAFDGSEGGHSLNAPIVAATAAPDGRGYFLAAADGGVFTYGDAHFQGSVAARRLTSPVVSMAVTPDGGGYILVGANGSVFSFGDAPVLGSEAGYALTAPVVAAAVTPDNGGYWLFSADGGVFNFGDATFNGSADSQHLNAPIVAAAVDSQTGGYWLVGADGGVFSFDAPFYGSEGGAHLNAPIVGITSAQQGSGYHLVAADGGLFDFGTAAYAGSQASHPLNARVIAVASVEP